MKLSNSTRPFLAILGASAALGLSATAADAAAAHRIKPRADLTVRNLNVDVSDEGTLLVSANLLNVGRKFARSSDVVIALSDDDVLDDADEVLDEVHFSRLGAGVKRSVDSEVEIPDDVDTSEDLNLLVCADGYDDVFERNEDNNCVSQTVTVDDLAPADDGSGADDPASDDGSDQTDPADDGQ